VSKQLAEDAARRLSGYFWLGLVVGAFGVVVALVAWPGTATPEGEGPVLTGDRAVAYAGLLLYGVGQLLVLLAVIGWGVMLGVRAAHDERLDPH
jgi:drug/metabolite transporter (DMT)-like permease